VRSVETVEIGVAIAVGGCACSTGPRPGGSSLEPAEATRSVQATGRTRYLPGVTQAIFGLVGVVIGGLITGFVQGVQEWRRDRADLRAAARLLLRELQLAIVGLRIARPKMETGVVTAIPANLTVWAEKQGLLARALSDADWRRVALAFDRLSIVLESIKGQADEWERVQERALAEGAPDDVDITRQAAAELREIASRAADMPYDEIMKDVLEAEPALCRIAFADKTWDPSKSVARRELVTEDAEGPAS